MTPGDDALLQCRGPKDDPIELLKWRKPGLESGGFLFYYNHRRFLDALRHESFRDRVQLKDPEMKDGEASVLLRNAVFGDAGGYECVVGTAGSSREFTSSVTLKVEAPGGDGAEGE